MYIKNLESFTFILASDVYLSNIGSRNHVKSFVLNKKGLNIA